MTSIHAIFDPATFTMTYVVWDTATRDAIVIDPVLDFDPSTQTVSQGSLGKLRWFIHSNELIVRWILDTHAHADHLTGSTELKKMWPSAFWGMSEGLGHVFTNFQRVFAWPKSVELRKLGVDRWFRDGEEFTAGPIRVGCIATPGHTPACMTYRIGNAVFTGDALFMPDSGTGRCDFPGGSAAALYDSIWGKLYALPDATDVFVGHDYQPGGRPLRFHSTIGEQKRSNIHLRGNTSKAEFVAFREGRDKTLSAPRLLNPSLDWNLGAHQLIKAI